MERGPAVWSTYHSPLTIHGSRAASTIHDPPPAMTRRPELVRKLLGSLAAILLGLGIGSAKKRYRHKDRDHR